MEQGKLNIPGLAQTPKKQANAYEHPFKNKSDGKAVGRVSKVHGRWIMARVDWDATVDFNGLPLSMKIDRDDDYEEHRLWVPEGSLERTSELSDWEKVYAIEGIGEKVEDCPVKVGDKVLLKGTILKAFCNPTVFFFGVDNVAATVEIESKLKL